MANPTKMGGEDQRSPFNGNNLDQRILHWASQQFLTAGVDRTGFEKRQRFSF